ncbi:hypothetical protein [Micromonospora nigra]|uniref:hypothetical protein n=1 Tax=Micromonospora nigra TaxID=145857 RepID=UPI001112FEC7|nr:hypothetical protein [Micromonospora nigra]
MQEGDELRLLMPHSDGINLFDWTGGATADGRDAWRLNLSTVLATYLSRYGYCNKWRSIASELKDLGGQGVVELDPLHVSDGFTVAMEGSSIEEREFVERFCRRLGLALQFNLDGLPGVLLSRSRKNPGGLMVREAVGRGIAIYRPSVFVGMVAEGFFAGLGDEVRD